MDEIADRAGVSKPVLYQHFPGKLDLYLALLDHSGEVLLRRLHEALSSTEDNKERVTATMNAYFEFVDDPAETYRLLFESDLTNESAVRDRLDRLNSACADEIAKIIAEDTGLPVEESHAARDRSGGGRAGVGAVLAGLRVARSHATPPQSWWRP